MKKTLILLLALSMVVMLAACGDKSSDGAPPKSQQEQQSGSETGTSDEKPDSSKPGGASDTLTLVKADSYNYVAMLDCVEEMTLAFDGDKVTKCSIKETYEDKESAKAGEAANKDVDFFANVTRDGNIVSYDYSDEYCNESFVLFEDKDMIIDHFTGEKGYTQK